MLDKFEFVEPSQSYIAKHAGVSLGYANKIIAEFVDMGLIGTIYRHRYACLYKLSSFFSPIIRSRLAYIFTAFLKIPLIIFFACNPAAGRECIPYKNKDCKDLFFILKKSRYMNDALFKMMYKDSPLSPDIRQLPFNLEQKINLAAFPDHVIKYALEKLNQVKRKPTDVYSWFWIVCKDYADWLAIEPNYEWSKHLATMEPLLTSIETANKLAPEKRSTTGSVSSPAARSNYTDSNITRDLKREGCRSHREWQGHPKGKETVSFKEAFSSSKEIQENLRRLGVRIDFA